jgi:predicted Zn-dependent protease
LKVKTWHILCFLVFIIGATILVFPTRRSLVSIYIENGMLQKARSTLTSLLAENPNDVDVLEKLSRLYLLEGEPRNAIQVLNRAFSIQPGNTIVLHQLARLYEWNREPHQAMGVWERISRLDPDDRAAWAKLIGFYRYEGDLAKEAGAVSRLVLLETQPPQKGEGVEDPFLSLLNRQLAELARQAQKQPDDILLNSLLSGLYLIRRQYSEDIADAAGGDDKAAQRAVSQTLGLLVQTDQVQRAFAVATQVDHLDHSGVQTRVALIQILTWNGMKQKALSLASRLIKDHPDNEQLLLTMARLGKDAGQLDAAITAYEKLLHNDPGRIDIMRHLADAWLQADRPGKAYEIYRKIAELKPDDPGAIERMLTAAQFSGDVGLMVQAARFAGELRPDDPAITRMRADLYLAMGEPRKAFPLYKDLADGPESDEADIRKMIDVARYTGDAGLVASAVQEALRLRPDDPAVIETAAGLYLASDNPGKANRLYQELAVSSGGDPKTVLDMLRSAGYTGDKAVMGQCLALAVRLCPDNADVTREAARMYLWVDRPDRAYAMERRLVVRFGGGKEAVDRMLKAAEYAGQPHILESALVLGAKTCPRDAELHLRLAELYLGAAQQDKAIKTFVQYLRLKPGDEAVERKLAEVYLWNNEPEEAYRIYASLYRKHPGDAAIGEKLLELASWTGRGKEAARIAGVLSDAHPQDFQKALAAGEAYSGAGELGIGLGFLERALALRPKQIDLRRRLATLYGWAGRTERQMSQLEYLWANGVLTEKERLALAQAYLDQKKISKVLALLKGVEGSKQAPLEEAFLLATAYELAGDKDRAAHIYQRLAREHGDDAKILADLGNRALWLNRIGLASHFYDAALKKDPKNLIALKGSAQIYAWNNDPERAIRRFEDYNRLNPDDYEVRYQLGELYFTNGRSGDAFKTYQKTMKLIQAARKRCGENLQSKNP